MRLYSVCAFRSHPCGFGYEYLSRSFGNSPFFVSLHEALAYLSFCCDLSLPWAVNDHWNSVVARSAEV